MPIYILADDPPEEPGYFTQALIDFVYWLIQWFCEMVRPLIEHLLGLFPDSWVSTIDGHLSSFSIYGGAINQWFALDWAFSLLGLWVIFMVVFLALKILLKLLIPGIG